MTNRPDFSWQSLQAPPLLFVALGVAAGPAAAWAEDFLGAGSGQSVGPARKTGVGFELRRKLASIDNPNFAIVTYVLPDFPEQGQAAVKRIEGFLVLAHAFEGLTDTVEGPGDEPLLGVIGEYR